MKNLITILLVTLLTSCGGSSSSDPADTTKQNAEGLPTEFLGNYHGIQPSYFMKNQYGDDMVINGNKVSVPSIDYKFLLKENKQVLNADFLDAAPYIFLSLSAVIGWALKKWAPFFNPYGRNKEYGISKEVFDAISKLYLDKEFVKDFVNILKKESNLKDIIARAQKDYYTDLYKKDSKRRNSYFDTQDYQLYIKGNIKGIGFQPDAKKIAQLVIKSNGYKKFSKKYKFTSDDDKDMVGVIYYIVTRPDFSDTAEKYLYTAASNNKNITIPPLPKNAFTDPGIG